MAKVVEGDESSTERQPGRLASRYLTLEMGIAFLPNLLCNEIQHVLLIPWPTLPPASSLLDVHGMFGRFIHDIAVVLAVHAQPPPVLTVLPPAALQIFE